MDTQEANGMTSEENKFILLWVAIAFIAVVGLGLAWYVNYNYSKELRDLTATLGPVPKSTVEPLSSQDVTNLEGEIKMVNVGSLDAGLGDIDKELK